MFPLCRQLSLSVSVSLSLSRVHPLEVHLKVLLDALDLPPPSLLPGLERIEDLAVNPRRDPSKVAPLARLEVLVPSPELGLVVKGVGPTELGLEHEFEEDEGRKQAHVGLAGPTANEVRPVGAAQGLQDVQVLVDDLELGGPLLRGRRLPVHATLDGLDEGLMS